MPIILSSPATGSRPIVPASPPRPMKWTGVDGSEWSLVGPGVNPRMRPGVKGLHMPTITVSKTTTPLVHGAEILDYWIGERSVYWPLLFRAASLEAWEHEHGAFMDSFDPIELGTWTVGQGEDARTLPLRGDFRGDYAFDRDPFVSRWAVIGVEMEAPRPLWRGQRVERTFSNAAGTPFLPAQGGPPLTISPAATFATATIDNPGDEAAYLDWTLLGPLSGIEVGVAGATIEVPFDLNAGEVLVIDTDPAAQYATLNGEDCTRELGFQTFGPVPKRGRSSLLISAAGAGKATAGLVPLWRRAF